MTKQIHVLHEKGAGKHLGQFVRNLTSFNAMYDCVLKSIGTTNIYKTVASFESAEIVPASDVPVGSINVKLNHLLSKAIEQITPQVHENMQLAAKTAKQWNEYVVIENQQEKLNGAIAKLTAPVKDAGIQNYSDLTDAQRTRVQQIFQKTLKSQEPLEINFITEAIDRYNAGASLGVMFKALNLKLDYAHGIALYEQSAYETLLSDEVFAYLLTRWESYQKMIAAMGEHKYLTPATFGKILDDARFGKSHQISANIKNALLNVTFDKALGEYIANTKSQTEYADIKPYMSPENVAKPISTNNRNRLAGLANIVAAIQEAPVYRVDESKSDLSSEEIHTILAIYYEVMDEISDNLMAFIFLTQTTVRNLTVVNDVIESIEKVDAVVTGLFQDVKNSAVEDGVVSQEGFNEILSKLAHTGKSISKRFTSKECETALNRLGVEYADISDTLFRLKLRDNNSLNDIAIKRFKELHQAEIQSVFGVDIGNMDAGKLFLFMTNGIFTTALGSKTAAPLSYGIYDSTNPKSVELLKFLNDEVKVERLLNQPFNRTPIVDQMAGAAAVSEDAYYSMFHRNDKSIGEFYGVTYAFTQNGTLFMDINNDCRDILAPLKLDTVPMIPYRHPNTNEDCTIGYGQLTTTAATTLFELFIPMSKAKVTLSSLKNSADAISHAKKQIQFAGYRDRAEACYTDSKYGMTYVKHMADYASDSLTAGRALVNEVPNLTPDERKKCIALMNYIDDDMNAAIVDCDTRRQLATLVALTSEQTATTIRELYVTFNKIANDFIALAK